MSSDRFGYYLELPENIREIFMQLCQDLVWLHAKRDFFLELYFDQENAAILHDMARGAFSIIHDTTRNDILIGICRLSDPEKTAGRRNLSLETLVNRCLYIENIGARLKQFQEDCSPIRKIRNKRLGHTDLNTVIQSSDDPLPGVTRDQIDNILREAGDILNEIYRHYVDGEISFKLIQMGDAKTLIHWLKTAKEYEEEKLRRLRQGIVGFEAHR